MGKRDPRIDAYIARTAEFAKPILTHLRTVVHAACPDVEETMKWSSPHFDYKGEMMASMAAFKEHCAFGFWKGALIAGVRSKTDASAGSLGRIAAVRDLPSRTQLSGYIKQAMKLNDTGVKAERIKGPPKKSLLTPADLTRELKSNKKATTAWEGFSPSARREYVAWITGAKTQDTRARRLETAVEWISEGKTRNWKYQK